MKAQIITGDCVDVMNGMAENSIDAIVTDPPTLLDDGTKRNADRANDVLPNIVFPNGYDMDVSLGSRSEFFCPPNSATSLHFMYWAVWIVARIAMPESTVDFEYDVTRQHEIKNETEPTGSGTNGYLSCKRYAAPSKFSGYFVFQFRFSRDAIFSNSSSITCGEFGFARFSVLIVIALDSKSSRFLRADKPSCSTCLCDLIRFCDDPARFPNRSACVMTCARTEMAIVLYVSLGWRAGELLPTSGAYVGRLVFKICCSKAVRTNSGACSLSSEFETTNISVISDATNRTVSSLEHKYPFNSTYYIRKRFISKGWDDKSFDFIGIEQDPAMAEIARHRTTGAAPLFVEMMEAT